MIEILKKMRFNGLLYKHLTNAKEIGRLETLAVQLMPLEAEIAASAEGSINVGSEGNWSVEAFAPGLTEKINELLAPTA